MPKTDRILGYLPSTFRAGVDRSALRSLVGAFGGELQAAENSLAAVMRSHWVDFADGGEERITDLACIGSLYGLAPRQDETVEEYREHLKRYVKTFLDGTSTVQGLLRVTAETLHLHIGDDHEDIDAWWERPDEPVEKRLPSGSDAATMLLGVSRGRWAGADAGPAEIIGPPLTGTLDLRAGRFLSLAVDGGSAMRIDMTAQAADPAAVEPAELVDAVNASDGVDGDLDAEIASNGGLRLATTSRGPSAEIEVADGPEDAAPAVLGLPPRAYEGADPTAATIVGAADIANPLDLGQRRYLRIGVDGDHLAEIDAAALAADPASVAIDQIVAAINAALDIVVGTHDGQHITLTSPTPGSTGHVALLTPAAQDATSAIFGLPHGFTFGSDAAAARMTGTVDLGLGVDLTARSTVRLSVDDRPGVTVDVAGVDPAATLPGEIVASLNAGLGADVASHDGRVVSLRSPTEGGAGALVLGEVDGDATETIFGTPGRIFGGTPISTASLTGTVDLRRDEENPLSALARNALIIAVDGAPPVEIDIGSHAADRVDVGLEDLTAAINAALGAEVATDDGTYLILVSPTDGGHGSIEVLPVSTASDHRFLSHALITDDAGTRLFGFTAREAAGGEAGTARLVGLNDLTGGVDLQTARYLRIGIDGGDPVEVDCAGPRPRATTVGEVAAAINLALGREIASTDGHVITLVSPGEGGPGAITLEPSQSQDAAGALRLQAGLVRGVDATGVTFAATPNLSLGIDLPADAAVAIGVDGAPPIDIAVGEGEPTSRNLSQLVGSINFALSAQVASHDGTRLYLSSPSTGTAAGIQLASPATGVDVGEVLFGVSPRTYVGSAGAPAAVAGSVDLMAAEPLGRRRFLRLSVDGGGTETIDVADRAADPADPTPSEIAGAVNTSSDAIASVVENRLRLTSPSTGSGSRIEIEHADVGDGRALLFGDVVHEVTGRPATPASLTGEVDLSTPADLSGGSVIVLAVDGDDPVEIDVAGPVPSFTLLSDIVATIERVLPGVAEATVDGRLRITSPTAGADSSVAVVALRRIELQEYPPEPQDRSVEIAHATRFAIDNRGGAAATTRFVLDSRSGAVGPTITATERHASVRIDEAVSAGGRLTIELGPGGIVATIDDVGGRRPVEDGAVKINGEPQTGDPEQRAVAERILILRRGRNHYVYTECDAARFDAAHFNRDRFAGGPCIEVGVFDVSRFSDRPDIHTVFATEGRRFTPSVLTAAWDEHRAGALTVNLPYRLDDRYGARFNDGRFGSTDPEVFAAVVTEPLDDPNFVTEVIGDRSGLVVASIEPRVPIGWTAVPMPFRDPQPLRLGAADQPARLYLVDEGLGDDFLLLEARHPGTWANEVTVTARRSGPAIYDLEVRYPGGRFENARAVVAGWPPIGGDERIGCALPGAHSGPGLDQADPHAPDAVPTLASQLLAPAPIGVLMASAAGVEVEVTRDRT